MNAKRISDYGVRIGCLPAGGLNKITDVPGIMVGHCTIDTVESKTGVTVIMPGKENVFMHKLVAASYVLNGFGKTQGLLQIDELGTLETPIALTNTLNVGIVYDALVEYTIRRCKADNIDVRSLNPVVGECNDALLNNIQKRAVKSEHVFSAIESACVDFDLGDVGAGKGTVCFGFKGGIGSASRIIALNGKKYTIGALVQSNFGKTGDLIIAGRAVGQMAEREISAQQVDQGSIVTVIATDLPVSARQLKRIIKRACVGLARTGSYIGHGSGDIMLGFSTANTIRYSSKDEVIAVHVLNERYINEAFRGAIEAVEEAVLDSMTAADTVIGYKGATKFSINPFLEKYLTEN